MTETPYETDFYAWLTEQAQYLRHGSLAKLDSANLAEELEDMGREQEHAVRSQLRRLLLHLLKWHYQPTHQSQSWIESIDQAREEVKDRLAMNPRFQPLLRQWLTEEYPQARRRASRQTRLRLQAFPPDCEWSLDLVMDDDFPAVP